MLSILFDNFGLEKSEFFILATMTAICDGKWIYMDFQLSAFKAYQAPSMPHPQRETVLKMFHKNSFEVRSKLLTLKFDHVKQVRFEPPRVLCKHIRGYELPAIQNLY